MTLTKEKQKIILISLLVLLTVLIIYRLMTPEQQKTAPLTYDRGAVAKTAVRTAVITPSGEADPLTIYLKPHEERYPGVSRNIFATSNPVPKPKVVIKPVTAPTLTIPPVPEKTPEEIAAELAQSDMQKFRYLGSMIDKESVLFLSKGGESFFVKNGEIVQKGYKVKSSSRDHVILVDTITKVEIKIDLAGGEQQKTR